MAFFYCSRTHSCSILAWGEECDLKSHLVWIFKLGLAKMRLDVWKGTSTSTMNNKKENRIKIILEMRREKGPTNPAAATYDTALLTVIRKRIQGAVIKAKGVILKLRRLRLRVPRSFADHIET